MSLERATAALSSADMAQPIFGKLQSFRRDNVAAVLCALAGLVGGVDYNRRLWVVVIQLVLVVVVGSLDRGVRAVAKKIRFFFFSRKEEEDDDVDSSSSVDS